MKLRLLSAALVLVVAMPASAQLWPWKKPAPATASASTTTEALPAFTYEEFKALAIELAPKVDLFRDIWAQRPLAEFFGGTSRDYLYWLRGQLAKANTAAELRLVIETLRARKEIKLREFVAVGSDVDVVVKRDFVFDGEPYGVKKVDAINIARFDLNHPVGQTEVWQGFIPIEKIRLTQTAVFTDVQFGDGVRELFLSKPTVHFATPRDFAKSYYATLGINHPVLLALRYVRIVAMDYHYANGTSRQPSKPTLQALLASLDKASLDAVTAVMRKSLDGKELKERLTNEKFVEWLTNALKKTTLSNTNADVSRLLFEHIGADRLGSVYPEIRPLMPKRPDSICRDLF